MRKSLSLLLLILALPCAVCAQQSLEEIRADVTLCGSCYVSYRAPEARTFTAPPEGYVPVYISHYARHGARFLLEPHQYAAPWRSLHRADSLHILTPEGQRVMKVLDVMMEKSSGRLGELTDIGAEQHRGIGARMAACWPEIFQPGAIVEARSTPSVRCVLSMQNELLSLVQAFPSLSVRTDASDADLYYLNCQGSPQRRNVISQAQRDAGNKILTRYDAAHAAHLKAIDDHIAATLFSSPAKARKHIDITALRDQLFIVANNMQSHSFATRGGHAASRPQIEPAYDLHFLFTPNDAAHLLWLRDNWKWYVNHGHCPASGGQSPFSQTNLLRSYIIAADSCLAILQQGRTPRPAATLRFGHDVCLLPLICLMELNEFGYRTTDPDDLAAHWRNYEIFTMASNVQLVFFRSKKAGAPILVKPLLNEREVTVAHLPQVAPGYYKWDDVRAFWLTKLTGK